MRALGNMTLPLKKESIMPRLDGIMRDIDKLRGLSKKGLEELRRNEDLFALSQFYLRQALEGIFHTGEHILSRLNGGRATEYKEIARLLGERGIVPKEFADTKLKAMAGYRNRLTHFYADVTPEEIHAILTNDLGDFETFLSAIRKLLNNPESFGLSVE